MTFVKETFVIQKIRNYCGRHYGGMDENLSIHHYWYLIWQVQNAISHLTSILNHFWQMFQFYTPYVKRQMLHNST